MRWFKHITSTRTDEKMALVLEEFGAFGYGAFWILLEMIAEKVDETDRDFVTYPESVFCKNLGVSRGKLAKFLQFFAEIEIFSVEKCGKLITVKSPNILKYRDEWTTKKVRNSGVNPERLRCKDTDTDTDTEIDKEKTLLTESPKESSSPIEKNIIEVEREPNGTRIPEGWTLSDENWNYASNQGLNPEEINLETEKFRNHWLAATGQRATKRDWDATWRNWVLNSKKWGGQKNANHNGPRAKPGSHEENFRNFLAAGNSWLHGGEAYPAGGDGVRTGGMGSSNFLDTIGEA